MEGKDKPRFTRFNKWLILVVTTLVMMVDFALLFSLGALYIDLMETYETDRATAAVVQSLMTGVTLGFGVFSGALISTLGLHGVTLIASVLVPLGFISSFFATSIHVLYITIGITSAIGTSLSHVSCVTVAGRVFKGRHQIMSITILNTAVGFASLGYPYLLSWLSGIFGLQGSFLILGGITSNTFILCIVCFINRKALSDGPLDHSKASESGSNAKTTSTDPIKTITDGKDHLIDTPDGDKCHTSLNLKHTGVSETGFIAETYDNIKYNSKKNDEERTEVDIINDREDELALEDNNGENVFKEDPTICIKHIECENNDQKEISEKNIVADKKEGTVKNKSTTVANETEAAKLETTHAKYTKVTKLKRHFETVHCLLKEIMTKPYVCLVLAFAFGNISLNGYLGVKLDIAMWKGLSESEGLSSFLAFNCSNIVSRFIPGLLKERKGINSFVYPVISAVSGFCGQLLIYFSGQLSVYMIGVCLCGIAFGGIVSSSINATVRIVSLEQVPIAVGFLISVNGILIVGVGPLFEKNIVADKKEGTVKNKSTTVANETEAAKLETTHAKYTKVTKLKRHFETVHCLLKEIMTKPYVCLVLAFAFGNISLNGYLGVKLDIAMWKGLSESEGLSSFLAFNCSNIVSRFIPGLLKERKGINSFVYPVISAVSGFCGQLLIYFSGQLSVYMIGVCLCGIAFGGIVSSSINATVRIVSLEQVPIAVGFLISVNGILIVGVGPLFGAVRDISGSYGSVIMTICSAQAAAAIFYLAAMFLRKQTHNVD